MNVLIVSETIHAGGAETFVLRLARKLNQLGVKTDILSLNPDLEDSELIAQFPDLTIHRAAPPMLRWVKRADRLLRMLGIDYSIQYSLTGKQIVKRGLLRYDVYHTHLMPVELLFARIKRQHPEVRIVSTLHGDYNDYEHVWQIKAGRRLLHWPQKMALIRQSVAKWVYISKNQIALFADTYKMSDARMRKIYNGYEPPVAVAPPLPHDETKGLRFIMVARGIPEKGWEYLVKGFRQLKGAHELVLVGKGPALDALKAGCKDDPRIRFTGFHPNPVELVQDSDVFVFPSVLLAESLPTVVIEALYCGKPVIATNVGEVAEMLAIPGREESAGLLLEPDKEHLADAVTAAMTRYIADRELLQRHQLLAREAFKKFDMAECAQKYIQVYEEVCNKN